MASIFISLAVIALVAALAPVIANALPNKLIPETVLLILAGTLLGPHMAGLIQLSDSVNLLSDLGMAFLFLLAGYEIDPRNLTGARGRAGFATWLISFLIALLLVMLEPDISASVGGVAAAIALTTTAIGALMPMLDDRELLGTRQGDLILSYGTFGEVCPVIAIALLMTTRSAWVTIVVLVVFAAIAILAATRSKAFLSGGGKLFDFLVDRADTTSQTIVRVTVFLLIALVALSAIFDLDIVLGAFAAGFVLRYVVPEGNRSLEQKLDAIGYGFLIPLFFVVSGAAIDLSAVGRRPVLLVGFIVMLMLVRFVPIVVSLSLHRSTRDVSWRDRFSVAFYCTTALPLIVAVTQVAVSSGTMDADVASVMVAAGAVTVFLMPLLASIAQTVADIEPIKTVQEIRLSPHDTRRILHERREHRREIAHEVREENRASFEATMRRRHRSMREQRERMEAAQRERVEAQVGRVEAQVVKAEAVRERVEAQREKAEAVREKAEATREKTEARREQIDQQVDAGAGQVARRIEAEREQVDAESGQVEVDRERVGAESGQVAAEREQTDIEPGRAEGLQTDAEPGRSEDPQTDAQFERAEDVPVDAESGQIEAHLSRMKLEHPTDDER